MLILGAGTIAYLLRARQLAERALPSEAVANISWSTDKWHLELEHASAELNANNTKQADVNVVKPDANAVPKLTAQEQLFRTTAMTAMRVTTARKYRQLLRNLSISDAQRDKLVDFLSVIAFEGDPELGEPLIGNYSKAPEAAERRVKEANEAIKTLLPGAQYSAYLDEVRAVAKNEVRDRISYSLALSTNPLARDQAEVLDRTLSGYLPTGDTTSISKQARDSILAALRGSLSADQLLAVGDILDIEDADRRYQMARQQILRP